MADWKLIKAKRLSTCDICGCNFPTGTEIYWKLGSIRCVADFQTKPEMKPEKVSRGTAGASAKDQYKKRSEKVKQERFNLLGKRLGAIANTLLGEGQSAEAWKKGTKGEEGIGAILDSMAERHGFKVLHDRAIPRSSANIDHILVSNRGIFVIDAKNYSGLVRIDEQGGILTPLIKTLYVGNRKQTKLVEGVKKQVGIVEKALEGSGAQASVQGVLAFYDAEWPIFFKPTEIDGVLINSKGVEAAVLAQPVSSKIDVEQCFKLLSKKLPAK
jgi:hypothetical protein